MPLIDIPDYLRTMLKIESIASDEKLVDCLDLSLRQSQFKPLYIEPLGRLELAIRDSNVYQGFATDTQERIVKRLRSFAPHNQKGKASKRDLQNEIELHLHTRLCQVEYSDQAALAWISFRVSNSTKVVKKRDVKRFEKEALLLNKYLAGTKPRVIAKELQITTKFISNTIELMKRKARAILMLQEREGLDEIGPRRPP